MGLNEALFTVFPLVIVLESDYSLLGVVLILPDSQSNC